MNIKQLLSQTKTITVSHPDIAVENTVAAFIQKEANQQATICTDKTSDSNLRIGVLSNEEANQLSIPTSDTEEWRFVRITEEGVIELYCSHTWFLYRLACQVLDDWSDRNASELK